MTEGRRKEGNGGNEGGREWREMGMGGDRGRGRGKQSEEEKR